MNTKEFKMDGTVAGEKEFNDRYHEFLHHMLVDMKDEGYTPNFDVPEQVRTWERHGTYWFEIKLQGVYVGDNAWDYDGARNGNLIWRSQQTKSERLSSPVAYNW